MKRTLFWVAMAALVLLCRTPTYGAMTYDQAFYSANIGYRGSGGISDPVYMFIGEAEGYFEGTSAIDAIRLLESTGATYYTKIQAGDQSANLTLTLPTAYAGSTGYVLSSTDAGVLSWAANGGTFTGGSITSDVTLSNGVDIYSSTTDAHTSSIGVRRGAAYVDALRWTNDATTPALVLGSSTTSLAITSTGLNVTTAGAVSGITTLAMGGALTGVTTFSMSGAMTADSYTFANGGVFSNDTDTELSFAENSEDLVWDFTTDGLTWKSSTGVVGMAFGDVDALTGINTIALDAAAGGLSLAADGAGDDLTLAVTGAQNASLVLASSGTAVDAMTLTTTAGGIDITNGGAASGEDLDLTSTSASINLTAGEAVVDAVVIASSGGFDVDTVDDIALTVVSGGAGEDILLTQTGANASSITLSAAGTATDTIGLQASAGGVDVDAAAAFDLGLAGGQVAIVSKDDAASAISLTANVGTSETIVVANTQGTDEAAINIDATAGGIDIDAATGKNIAVTGGQFIVTSNEAVASAINLVTNTGAAETIVVTNTQGTGAGAITLAATAGGVDIDAAATLDASIAGGQVALVSKDNAASAISLTTNVGVSETIAITNTAGTGEDALNLDATAGGIDIDFATAKNMAITGGQFIVTSNESVASAINLVTNTGVLETIVATNTQGTDEGAITLTSTAGGVDINAAALKNITLDGGQILLESADDVASSIALTTNNGTSETIVVTNTQGTAVGAVTLTATAGGITLASSAGTSFSDDDISNVGKVALDTIVDDATATIGYFTKTRKVTIGHVGDATADFQWATGANHTAQNLDLGSVVPAFARVVDVCVICTETMVGQTNMLLVVGNQSAGTEFITSTDCDTINNAIAGAAAGTPFVAINNAASNVWVNGDPDDNTWAAMSAGQWTVLITYQDNSAASSAL